MSTLLGPLPRKILWLAFVAPFVILVVTGMLYTRHVQHEADQRWCQLMVLLDNQYQAIPPETETGQQFAAIIHVLREELDC